MDLLTSLRKHAPMAMDKDIAMGVREGGKWYYEVKGKPKVGPFDSREDAKAAAIAKGYDW